MLRVASKAVVDSFASAAQAMTGVNRKFARTNVPHLKEQLVNQLCEATGGPCTLAGACGTRIAT